VKIKTLLLCAFAVGVMAPSALAQDLPQAVRTEREMVVTANPLATAAGEWHGADREPGYLLTGARLTEFVAWRERSEIALTETEGAFLDACLERRAHEERRERERSAHEADLEHKAAARRKVLLAVMTIAAVVSTVLAGWAIGVWRDVSPNVVALLYAFLAGLMLISTIREKLSTDESGSFWPFLAGVFLFTVLLLLLEQNSEMVP